MPSTYFPVQKHQTELDMSDVKSDAPARLINTDIYIGKGKNRELTESALKIAAWPKFDINDPDQLRSRIERYFMHCVESDSKPSVAGFALSLKVSKETIFRIVRGDITSERKYSADTVSAIRDAYLIFDSLWMDYMQNGQINPASGIFLGKNLFGYRDVVDYTISPGAASSSVSADDLARKYEQLPAPDDGDDMENS